MKHCTRLTSIFIFGILVAQGTGAHPHTRIWNRFDFVWKGTKLAGVYLEWTFDRFFSEDIIWAYDVDENGKFDKAETLDVYERAFDNLKNYDYFTFIRVGSKRSMPKTVSDFSVRIVDNAIVYRFYVDLSAYASREIAVAVYDYTFFCDIPYQESNPAVFTYDPDLVTVSYEIAETKDYPVYYDPLGAANDKTVYDSWEKGLLTFYPKEVKIIYDPH